ncbi:MAG TPA: hypothetical protein VJB12_03180 [Candidatus Nanoarchaeia archaeon]|nr:hypothetical protein [Candidatus Nanoarchaeia archaeon]
MGVSFNGKPLVPTKTASEELVDIDFDLERVPDILETGFEIRKREKGVIERGIPRGKKVVNVVVVDRGDFFKLIHAGEFTLSKKFRKLAGDKNGPR